jgi:lipopolysaccharide export system permease protein
MLIIDRYLLRQFIGTFLVCYLSLTGLYIVFDAFTNLDGFLRCAEKTGGLLPLMASFYGYQSIMFFDRLSGLLTLVAAMFTVAWIQRHQEMTALMAAGISRLRIVRPLMVAGIAIALLAVLSREALIPRFREQLSRRSQDLIGDVAQTMRHRYDSQTGVLLAGKATFRDRQRIAEPSFVIPQSRNTYGKQMQIVAEEAFYEAPTDDRPGGYRLVNIQEPKNLDARPTVKLGERPVVITRRDAAWLGANECFVISDVTFEQLTGGQAFKQFASTWQLIEGLRNPSLEYGSDVRVAVHARVVQPLLDATLLFLGLPLVVTRHHRNVFVAIGMGLGLVTLFMLTVITLQYAGSVGFYLTPAGAAWAPLMIFVPAAVAMFEGMRE